MSAVLPQPAVSRYPDSLWRSLQLFNAYRVTVAALILLAVAIVGAGTFLGWRDRMLFVYADVCYLAFGVLCFAWARVRRPELNWQLTLQVSADIVFIVLLMYASGGIASGLGLLLLAVLAGAGMISRGRLALFHAALASIGILLEHTYQVLRDEAIGAHYVQAGFLSIGFFATAWVAHVLARHTKESERIAAQREVDLANMAEVNQLIIRDMDTGVLVIDADGRVRSGNAKASALLGMTDVGHAGASLWERVPVLAAQISRWQAAAPGVVEPLTTLMCGKPVSVRFVQVGRYGDVGAVLFLEDMTRVQVQARQMKLASLGRLTANIAHEIRNPLSAISHATELLQEEGGLDATARRLLAIIHDNTQRLDRMVQDVLRLNRRDRAHREQFVVTDYLHSFVRQFCDIEKTPDDLIKLEFATHPIVVFDRSHLNQVMWNLCRNALRHCRGLSGSIRIRVAPGTRSDRVKLSVMDDGPGVAPEDRVHLFEPFFTTVATGTGLGIYIAREVCEANEASLEYVESTAGGHFCVECRRIESG